MRKTTPRGACRHLLPFSALCARIRLNHRMLLPNHARAGARSLRELRLSHCPPDKKKATTSAVTRHLKDRRCQRRAGINGQVATAFARRQQCTPPAEPAAVPRATAATGCQVNTAGADSDESGAAAAVEKHLGLCRGPARGLYGLRALEHVEHLFTSCAGLEERSTAARGQAS